MEHLPVRVHNHGPQDFLRVTAAQGGAADGGDQSACGSGRLVDVPPEEGLFETAPDLREARRRLHARLDQGGKVRRQEIPEGTPVPHPHLRGRKRTASQLASRIAPLHLETVGTASSQSVVNSLFVLWCAVMND